MGLCPLLLFCASSEVGFTELRHQPILLKILMLHSWQYPCIPTVVVARVSDSCNSCVPFTLAFILCNGTTTDLIALMFKPFSHYSTSIGPHLNLAGRNGSFSCCLLTNLPRATLQLARKAMCLWHRAKPASLSVDQDFFPDMFHVLKSNDLFFESYFFLFHM